MRHLHHLARGLAALTVAVLFVIGVPAGLIVFVGWPLPTSLPTLDQVQLALRSGIDPQLLINTLAVVVWVTWAQLVAAVAVETVAAVRGRTARRLPVLPGLQPAVAQLVAAITLAVATLGPLRALPATAAPLTAPAVAPAHPTTRVTSRPAAAVEPVSSVGVVPSVDVHHATYRVGRFDTLWSIAEATLGDGRRWQEIRDLNIGRVMPDGHRITQATDRLTPGWELILPADAQPPDRPTEVTVEGSDSFWRIAADALTDAWERTPTSSEIADYWQQLIDTNRDRLQPPHDPNLIYPGQTFTLPPIPADPQADTTTPTRHSRHGEPDRSAEITVKRGDSFWRIAEDALTDACGRTPTTGEIVDYWQQVIDTNRDRLQPPHDPNLIYPGQTFTLPPIPADPQTPPPVDHGLDPAAEPQQPAVETPTASDTGPDPSTSSAPTSTAPTEDVDVSNTVAEPQPAVPTPTPSSDPGRTHQQPESMGQTTEAPEQPDSRSSDLFPTASRLTGLGILAAGLVALLQRLRRTQLRHRHPNTIPTPPPPEARTTEITLREAAAPTALELVDLALRAMARDVTTNHIPPPDVVGIHLTSDILRLLLWTPHHHPPTGWEVDDDGRSWTLPTRIDVEQLRRRAEGVPAPYPTLVTVGHNDDTHLLLDLEHLGAVQITGNPSAVTAATITMATELAASPLADSIDIVCVAFGDELAHLERIRAVDSLDDVLPAVETKADAVANLGSPTPLDGRLAPTGADTWHPLVILDPAPTPPPCAERLLAIAHSGRAVAAVVGYPTGGRWRLRLEDDTIRIDPLGWTLARRNLTPNEQAAIADLVTAAQDPDGIPTDPVDELVAGGAVTDRDLAPTLGLDEADMSPSMPAGPVEVRVLGPVHVAGIDRRFPARKCVELVTYLAFHRQGVEADVLMEALWPEQAPNSRRLSQLVSRARLTLGDDPDGIPYVPYVTDGLYRISSHLQTDLDTFIQRIRAAEATSAGERLDHLHAALDLVQAAPFSGVGSGYAWAHTEGIGTHAIVAVDNTAHQLADLALDAGQLDLAEWAARRGLIATYACEACYRNLMRIAIAQQNPVALEAIYTELLTAVDADDGPDAATWLEPETVELYERHSRRHRRAG